MTLCHYEDVCLEPDLGRLLMSTSDKKQFRLGHEKKKGILLIMRIKLA